MVKKKNSTHVCALVVFFLVFSQVLFLFTFACCCGEACVRILEFWSSEFIWGGQRWGRGGVTCQWGEAKRVNVDLWVGAKRVPLAVVCLLCMPEPQCGIL